MNQIRRYAGFLALVVIIILAALLVREWLTKPCLLPAPFCGPPTPVTPPEPSEPSKTPTVTITSILAKAELATVEYKAIAEVPNESVPNDLRGWLGAKEQITLLVYGNVKAGFDLSKLRENDLWTDGTRVQLHLPAPEILSTSIDFTRTHAVRYEKTPIIIANDPDLEKKTLRLAEDAVHQAAVEAGIFENASKYGQLFFENFLRSLGFTEVKVIVN